jgi:hypothetical protein
MEGYQHTVVVRPNAIPDMATTEQLVEAGVFMNTSAASYILRHGCGPKYFKVRRFVIYLKADVLDWLQSLGRLGHAG